MAAEYTRMPKSIGTRTGFILLTIDCYKGVGAIESFWVVTNAKYVDIVKEQIPGVQECYFLEDPEE